MSGDTCQLCWKLGQITCGNDVRHNACFEATRPGGGYNPETRIDEANLKATGLKKGDRVLYVRERFGVADIEIVTIKQVGSDNHGCEILYTEELDGYIDSCDVYTKETILKMFEGKI